MLKYLLLGLFACSVSIYAQSVEWLIKQGWENNYDLQALEKSVQIADANTRLAGKWNNPMINISATDIWLNDPFTRSHEAMQGHLIGISQMVPIGGKLGLQKQIAKKEATKADLALQEQKLQLRAKIYEYAHSAKMAEETIAQLVKFEGNLHKLERLVTSLYKHQKTNQNIIPTIKILLENVALKKQNITSKLENFHIQLEQMTITKVQSITQTHPMSKVTLVGDVSAHPKIQLLQESISSLQDKAKLEKAKKYSDLKLGVSFVQRDEKFNNYLNISASIPLSLYGAENTKSSLAQIKALQASNKLTQEKHNMKLQIQILQNNLNTAHANYQQIKETIIPLQEKIQTNIQTYNEYAKTPPQELITNLNELITIELRAINEKQKYYNAYSKLSYFDTKGLK